jgi:hypothetical protein
VAVGCAAVNRYAHAVAAGCGVKYAVATAVNETAMRDDTYELLHKRVSVEGRAANMHLKSRSVVQMNEQTLMTYPCRSKGAVVDGQ